MKRYLVLAMLAALLVLPNLARAQYPGPQGPMMFSSGCASSPQMGGAYLCFDTTKNAFYYWSGTAFVSLTAAGGSFTLSWDGALGGMTNAAVAPMIASCSGHFTQLACTATLTGSCTTGPTINIGDITGSTTGTAVSPTTTVATVASHSETLSFSSGDTIALEQTATTNTCTAPTYHCTATATCP
jgi:hypothetical protein